MTNFTWLTDLNTELMYHINSTPYTDSTCIITHVHIVCIC